MTWSDDSKHLSFLCDSKAIPNVAQKSYKDEPIKIGLLVPQDTNKDPLSLEAMHAIKMAIKGVNDDGGINGRKVKIVTRACDGNWGTGSKQAVNLVYDENVCALIGSLDGRNAHLAEQVATKAQIVFISTRATDPTLAQINIPWFFRVVPDDIQQSELLVTEIYQKKDLDRICIISSESYDDKMKAKTFTDLATKHNHHTPDKFFYSSSKADFENLINKTVNLNYNGILFLGNGRHLSNLINRMKDPNIDIPIYSMLSSMTDISYQDLNTLSTNDNLSIVCPKNWFDGKGKNFRNQFKDLYNYEPGIIGAYSFDGINTLIHAIKNGNTQSDEIREQLSTLNNQNMLMGPIRFNSKGNSERQVSICNLSANP